MQIGSNVVWTTSEGKTFGNLWANDNGRYTIKTAAGEMSFPHGDGTLEIDSASNHPIVLPEAKPAPASTLTKFEQCEALYNSTEFVGHGRKAIIQAFVDRLGMTAAGAATYYYKCTKR